MAYVIENKNKKVTLPNFSDLPAGVARKARKLPAQEQSWWFLEQILTDKELEVIDGLTLAEFAKHMKAWTEGVGLGEAVESSN
jgi:hypothetical protein